MHARQTSSRQSHRRFRLSFIGLFLLCTVLVTSGAICGGADKQPPEKVVLEIWRPEDQDTDFADIFAAYKAIYPHVDFKYKTMKPEEYEDELFKAWAKGEGPDIFAVSNWRIGKFTEFITPMPKQRARLKTAHTEKSFGKAKLVVEQNVVTYLTPDDLPDRFVETVKKDVVFQDDIYGLPYSVDTLAMYYNRDLLAQSLIAIPPTTWQDFVDSVEAITVLDADKNVIQPATGLGTADNVPHFFDIVSLIMMQSGTQMITPSGYVALGAVAEDGGPGPGTKALEFYQSFSNPGKATYTWNDEQIEALEAFTSGNLAFYFGYHQDLKTIEQRAPNLNFSYTKVPQVDSSESVNYANYLVESVHLNAENPDHAWNFIQFAASENQAKNFIEKTGRVPALQSLVGAKQEDKGIGIFAQQALTAKTWYHGPKPDLVLQAFQEMVVAANERVNTIEEILNVAGAKVRLTLEQ